MQYQQGYRPPQQQLIPPGPKRRRKRSPVLFVLVALLVVALIAGGTSLGMQMHQNNLARQALENEVGAVQNMFLPNIYVDGIHLGGMTAQEGIDAVVNQINARQSAWTLQLTYQGHVFYTLDYAFLGIQTDIAQVYSQLQSLYQLGKIGTLQERKQEMDAVAAQPVYALTVQTEMNDTNLDIILGQIRDVLTYDAKDAALLSFNPDQDDPFSIQSEQYGSTLDIAPLKQRILEMAAAGEGGALEVTPTAVAPQVTAADIRSRVTLLAEGVTPVSSSSTVFRTNNIRTAFSRINGTVLEPGKSFSFNKTAKERSAENGYQPAIEYGEGGLETMGIGGGVCQASTTVYLAALRSGLEILERSPHADEVSYTTFGQDATVVYNRLDLRFRNNTNSTIYITARVADKGKKGYECQVRIYGLSLGQGVSYKLRTQTVETIPAPLAVTYKDDKDHAYVTYKDEEPVLVRKARDGFINETYLQKWQNGQLMEETFVSRDTCKAREAVYAVGTLTRKQ